MRCNLGNHDWIYLAEVMMIIDAWSYSTLNRGGEVIVRTNLIPTYLECIPTFAEGI